MEKREGFRLLCLVDFKVDKNLHERSRDGFCEIDNWSASSIPSRGIFKTTPPVKGGKVADPPQLSFHANMPWAICPSN